MVASMLRIYLDQNAWIALLKARQGRPDGSRGEAALALLEAAVAAGNASLPLSHIHYRESAHRKPRANRLPLTELMADLSRFHTVAPFWKLGRSEVRTLIA